MKISNTIRNATNSTVINTIVGILLLASTCYAQAAPTSITLLVDDWCPYTCDINSDKPGIAVEVIRAVFGKDKVLFKNVEWDTAIKTVENVQADGLAVALTSDAPFFIYQKTAITTSKVCFFVPRTSQWLYEDIASLKDKNLITVKGYSYGETLDDYIAHVRKKDTKRIIELRDKDVAAQRFAFYQGKESNVIVAAKRVFEHQLKDYNQYQTPLEFHNRGCLAGGELHIAFSPKNKNRSLTLAHQFELGLQQLKSNGEFAKIISKY